MRCFALLIFLLTPVSLLSQENDSYFIERSNSEGEERFGDFLYQNSQTLFFAASYGDDVTFNDGTQLKATTDHNLKKDAFIGFWDPSKPALKWVKPIKQCNPKSALYIEFIAYRKEKSKLYFKFSPSSCDSGVFWNGQTFTGNANHILMKTNDKGGLNDWLPIFGAFNMNMKFLNDTLAVGVFFNQDTVVKSNNTTLWQAPKGSYTYALLNENLEIIKTFYVESSGRLNFVKMFTKKDRVNIMTHIGGDSVTSNGPLSFKNGWSEITVNAKGKFNIANHYNAPYFFSDDCLATDNGYYFTHTIVDTLFLSDTFLTKEQFVKNGEFELLLKLNDDFKFDFVKSFESEKGSVSLSGLSNKKGNQFSLLGVFSNNVSIFNEIALQTEKQYQYGYFALTFEEQKGGLRLRNYNADYGPSSRSNYFNLTSNIQMDDNNNLYLGGNIRFESKIGDDTLNPKPPGLSDAFVYKLSEDTLKSGKKPIDQNLGLSVYPNPVRDKLKIHWEGRSLASKGRGEYVIVNSFGQVVETFFHPGQKTTLDVSDLKPGVYFIKHERPNSEPVIKSFIKH